MLEAEVISAHRAQMDAEIARRKGAAGVEGGTETAQSLAGMYGVAKSVNPAGFLIIDETKLPTQEGQGC